MTFEQTLESIVKQTAEDESIVGPFTGQASADTKAFLDDSKANLATWQAQVQSGDLAKDDLLDLISGQMDLAQMHGLKQAGLAEAQMQRFKAKLTQLITDAIYGAVKLA